MASSVASTRGFARRKLQRPGTATEAKKATKHRTASVSPNDCYGNIHRPSTAFHCKINRRVKSQNTHERCNTTHICTDQIRRRVIADIFKDCACTASRGVSPHSCGDAHLNSMKVALPPCVGTCIFHTATLQTRLGNVNWASNAVFTRQLGRFERNRQVQAFLHQHDVHVVRIHTYTSRKCS